MRRLAICVLFLIGSGYSCSDYRIAPIGFAYDCIEDSEGCYECKLHPSYDTHSAEYRNAYMGFAVQIPAGAVGFSTHMVNSERAWLDNHGVAIDPVTPTGRPIDPDGNDKPYLSVDAQCNVAPKIDEFLEGELPGTTNLRKSDLHFGKLVGRKMTYQKDIKPDQKRKLYYIDYWFGQPNGEYSIYYDVGLRTTAARLKQDQELLQRVLAGFSMMKPIGTCD